MGFNNNQLNLFIKYSFVRAVFPEVYEGHGKILRDIYTIVDSTRHPDFMEKKNNNYM